MSENATNIYINPRFTEFTDNNGVFTRIPTEGMWQDFYEKTVADKKKPSRLKSSDFTIEFNGCRYRACLADSNDGYGLALRKLPSSIPSFREDLKLDWNIIQPLLRGTGLTLFAGIMGSGKSTTMLAALEKMDKQERGPLGTVEDPIEAILQGPQVVQREVGTHVESFSDAIRDFVRQNRSTIMVSEIRDPATANAALLAAMTGLSVVATIHADSALDVVPRFIALVDEKYQRMVPRTLRGLWWQHVLRFSDDGRAPIPVYESLEVSGPVRQILESGPEKLPQLANEMHRQGRKNMAEVSMELVRKGLVKREEVMDFINRRGRINTD